MYNVRCVSCGELFDAVAAPRCDCLEEIRSVQCPTCKSCFCKSDEKYKTAFWEKAPQAMRERRTELLEYPSPDKVPRPLILFADDDPTARAIIRRVVQGLAAGVMVLRDGADLVELTRRYRPDLVITDALMPGMDGREAARIIKTELPATRVIVITSVYKGSRYKNEAMVYFGVDDYLSKPVTPKDLRAAIVKNLPKVE